MKERRNTKAPWYSVTLCIMTMAALIFTIPLSGCKDYDDDVTTIQEEIDNKRIDISETNKTEQAKITALQTEITDLQTTIKTTTAQIETIKKEIDAEAAKQATAEQKADRVGCTCP